MPHCIIFCLSLVLALSLGCSSNQSVKNTWKGTRNMWYSYVNVPASIDYDDSGQMKEYETTFAKAIMGIDLQLQALERAMQNADKPPTPEWLNAFFTKFPWVDGITGLNGDGGIVGQAGRAEKTFDFQVLLENDPKQKLHALRACVQDSDDGPEVLLAVPLYDGPDFLGIVVAYFEMRSLMSYSDAQENLIVTSPGGLLWAGSSAGTLPDADWAAIARRNTDGSISGSSGSYQWVSRFLGNYPLIFAIQKTAPGKAQDTGKTETPPSEKTHSPDESASSEPAPSDADSLDLSLPPLPNL